MLLEEESFLKDLKTPGRDEITEVREERDGGAV